MLAMLDVLLLVILAALMIHISQCDALVSIPRAHLEETLTREPGTKPHSSQKACPLMQDFDATRLCVDVAERCWKSFR